MEKYKTSVLEYEDVQSAMRYMQKSTWDKAWDKSRSDVAQNMLRMNLDISLIAQATGLPKEQILRLRIN